MMLEFRKTFCGVNGLEHEQRASALDIAALAGEILLASGAEIFRVEETIDRICRAYGVASADAFVLSSGIFLTAGNETERAFARVRHILLSGARLDRVAAAGAGTAVFCATVLVVFLSRLSAVVRRCPVTLFLVPGIFPLVPGLGMYWTAYYLVTDRFTLASQQVGVTLRSAVAIVLGILLVLELPQGLFRRLAGPFLRA